ncbi:MAG TPA: polysaccharide biosynthesis tyrosine autokinase [Anaerolineales bacterium]|nr:polysaccharide biosynthesis tyrosine autokinase [Anaerolineales bacterium]
MELRQYISIMRRWAWLLLLGLILGASGGFFGSSYQIPIYQASTRLLVMRAPQDRTSDYAYLSDQQLTQTYLELATTQPVLNAVSEQLGSVVKPKQIEVRQIRDTQVIELTIEDQDPTQSAIIANTLVDKLIKQNEALQSVRFASTEANLQEQIKQMEEQISGLQTVISQVTTQNLKDQMTELEAQITPLQEEKTKLEQEIAALEPAYNLERRTAIAEKQARISQIDPLLSLYQEIYSNLVVLGKPLDTGGSDNIRLTQLQKTLDLYQGIYVNLLNSLESLRLARLQNTPNIVQIEPATVPLEPIRPRPLLNTVLAGVLGLMLAAGIIFLVEYLDDTIKTMEDVERILQVPVIGYIAEIKRNSKSEAGLYVVRQPRSPVSEAFRLLRTNLEFAGVDHPIRRLLVTSTGPNEGKTTIVVNLAAVISQGGRKVVLMDADLRRPKLHRFLGLPNQFGLSDLFRGEVTMPMITQHIRDLENVSVITTGSLPPNPSELLGSLKMDHILDEAQRGSDLVILDSPPSLVADVQILAAKVDAVVMVVYPGHTQADAAQAAMEQLKRAGTRVVGVVLNRIPRHRADYYGGYRYYSPYNSGYHYYPADSGKENGKSPFRRLFAKRSFSTNGHKETTQEKDPVHQQD